MPPLVEEGLRPAQVNAIRNLEASLADQRRRALIQMASGGGKTYTACNVAYRLIKYAGAKRILFLVDRSNLGRQTLKEFQAFVTPDENRLFTELYNVQHMQSNKQLDASKRPTQDKAELMWGIRRNAHEICMPRNGSYNRSHALVSIRRDCSNHPAGT